MRHRSPSLAGVLVVGASVVGPLRAQQPEGIPPPLALRVDSAVLAYMVANHIPGLSIAIAARGGIAYARGYGLANLEDSVAVSTRTVFRTASTLKLLTATAVLQLKGRGRLDLDAPIQRYCSAFPKKRWTVTARELLLHEGGIRASSAPDVFNREHYQSVRDAVRRFADDSLRYEPGTQTLYSNEGYTLLACAIEGASGESYDEYLRKAILVPTRMTHTFAENVYDVMPHRARSYLVRTADNTKAWEGLWTSAQLVSTQLDTPAVADPVDPSWSPGAGNYRSTPTDMARFVLALERGILLSDSSTQSAFAPVITPDGKVGRHVLGAWILSETNGEPVFSAMGSDWNGSFGIMTLRQSSFTVATASNIEFDTPDELVTTIARICGYGGTGGGPEPRRR